MRCPNCGNENPPDYMFCDECGARLTGVDQAADTAASAGEGNDAGSTIAAVGASTESQGQAEPMGMTAAPANADAGANMTMDSGMAGAGDMGNGMDSGMDSAQANEPASMTEDTMPSAMPSYSYDAMSGGPAESGDSQASQEPPMPDVIPMASSDASEADNADMF